MARQIRLAEACQGVMGAIVEALESRAYLSAISLNPAPHTAMITQVVPVEVNGDGKADVITVYNESERVGNTYSINSHVSLFLSNADGSLMPAQVIDTDNGFATSVAAADLTGNGKTDLVFADSGDVVAVLLGNGDGTFEPALSYFSGNGPSAVVAGDFNGDGKPDIVTVNNDGTVGVLLGCGDGAFSPVRLFPDGLTGNSGLSIQAVDLNNGGLADLVIEDSTGNVSVLLANSDGSFAPARVKPLAGGQVYATTTIAADGEHPEELLLGRGQSGGPSEVQVLQSKGNGNFKLVQTIVTDATGSYGIGGLAAGDLAGDGGLDLLVADHATRGRILEFVANNDGTFGGGRIIDLSDGQLQIGVSQATGGNDQSMAAVSDEGNDVSILNTTATPPMIAVNGSSSTTKGVTTVYGGFIDGASGSVSVLYGGDPEPQLSILSGTLPPGMTLSDDREGTAVISGTPLMGTTGNYNVTLKAVNGVSPRAVEVLALTIYPAAAFTSADHFSMQPGANGSFTVSTEDVGTSTFLLASGNLPSGVSINDNGYGSATISGTPAAGTEGAYPLQLEFIPPGQSPIFQSFTLTVARPPVITSPSTFTMAVGVAGSFAVTSTGNPKPALTLISGTLPAGLLFHDNSDGTAIISGTPATGTAGTYLLTLRAKNGSENAKQAFTLTVTAPASPAFTSAASADFTTSNSGSFIFSTAAAPTATLSIVQGVLPGGLSFVDNHNGTATLSGTPAEGAAGTYPLVIQAKNGVSPKSTQQFTLTVNEAMSISGPANIYILSGSTSTFTFTATGNPTPSLKLSGGLPGGVTFHDNGNGTATIAASPGAPSSNSLNTYYPVITSSNGVEPAVQQSLALIVEKPAAANITSAASATFTAGQANQFTITASGALAPSLAILSGTLPAGVTFVDNGDGTATLSGNPPVAEVGIYNLTIRAKNAQGPRATQAFTLSVMRLAAPVITSANTTIFYVGNRRTFNITATGFPAPTLNVSLPGNAPAGFSIGDNGIASISGVPGAGTGGVYIGTETATNGVGPGVTEPFTLVVDQQPVFTSENSVTLAEGLAGSFTIKTTGYPAPALTLLSQPALDGLTFHDNGDGTASLSGTPVSGTYQLSFQAENGFGPAEDQSFTLNVDAAQPPAFTSAASGTFAESQFVPGGGGFVTYSNNPDIDSFTIKTSGVPAAAVSLTSGSLPEGLTFHHNGDGTATISGLPVYGTQGVYHLTLRAHNGQSPAATQAYSLTVPGAPVFLSADNFTMSEQQAGSFTVTTRGLPTAALSIVQGSLPVGVSFVDNFDGTATIFGTPAQGTAGSYVLQLDALNPDIIGVPATQRFILTVNAAVV